MARINSINISGPIGSFGDLQTAELVPEFQRNWVYGLDTLLDVTSEHGSGSVVATANHVVVASGTTTSSLAEYRTRNILRYGEGQGALIRFTALFTEGVAGTEQWVGFGNGENGLFFGYLGTTFGVNRRTGGQLEIRTLTISSGASGSGTITITLNGGAGVGVSVTNGDSIAEIVTKIAASNFSAENGGWSVFDAGDRAIFVAISAEARSGAYSLEVASTGVAGSIAQTIAAVTPTDNFTAQASWSDDHADDSKILPALDPTQGNIYEISFQYLGYGQIGPYKIENPSTGKFTPVHREPYANTETSTSLGNPSMPFGIIADNKATTDDITIKTSSVAAFSQGPRRFNGGRFSVSKSKATGTTEQLIQAIRLKLVANSKTNKARAIIQRFGLASDSIKSSAFRLVLNPGLVGSPSWSDVAGSNGMIEVDTTSTDVAGGTELFPALVGAGASSSFDWSSEPIVLVPGDVLAIVGNVVSGASSALNVNLQGIMDI